MTGSRRGFLAAVGSGVATLTGCLGLATSGPSRGSDGSELSLVAVRAPRFAQQGDPFTVTYSVRNGGVRPAPLKSTLEVERDREWMVTDEVDVTVDPGEVVTVTQSDVLSYFASRKYRLAAFDHSVTVKTMCNCTHI